MTYKPIDRNGKPRLPVPTPGHARSAELLAYCAWFEPDSKSWNDRRKEPLRSEKLAHRLERHDPEYRDDPGRFYTGRWVRALQSNPYGEKGKTKAPPRVIRSTCALVYSVFPPLHSVDAQSAMDEMDRVAMEDDLPPLEALRRLEEHYNVFVPPMEEAIERNGNAKTVLDWKLVLQHLHDWKSELIQDAIANAKGQEPVTEKLVGELTERLNKEISKAIKLSREVRAWVVDPANGVAPSPVIQGSLYKMLSNELNLRARSPRVNLDELWRLAKFEEFFELSLQHNEIVPWYQTTPLKALAIASMIKNSEFAFKFGMRLLHADCGFRSRKYKPFAGDRALEEQSFFKFYLENIHDKVVAEYGVPSKVA